MASSLFTGREYHQVVGIYDYRHRAYDPDLGRFLQRDPPGNWYDPVNFGNAYAYVGGDPGNGRDPWGLWMPWEHKAMSRESLSAAVEGMGITEPLPRLKARGSGTPRRPEAGGTARRARRVPCYPAAVLCSRSREAGVPVP